MNKKLRMRHCFNCGAEVGFSAYHDPLDTCGEPECEREARYQQECQDADARERAEQDGYERYR